MFILIQADHMSVVMHMNSLQADFRVIVGGEGGEHMTFM